MQGVCTDTISVQTGYPLIAVWEVGGGSAHVNLNGYCVDVELFSVINASSH